jgi:hypothetical protein
MNKLLLRTTLVLSLFLFMSFTFKVTNEEHSKILGAWEYMSKDKGYSAQKGLVIFSVQDGKLIGNVLLADQIIPMRNLVFENDRVRAYIFVAGVQVDLYLKFKMNSFEGTVSNPSGYIKVEGCKKD